MMKRRNFLIGALSLLPTAVIPQIVWKTKALEGIEDIPKALNQLIVDNRHLFLFEIMDDVLLNQMKALIDNKFKDNFNYEHVELTYDYDAKDILVNIQYTMITSTDDLIVMQKHTSFRNELIEDSMERSSNFKIVKVIGQ